MPQSHFFPAGEALSDFAEAIWDADFDDARSARALTIKVLPTTSPVLIVHYRAAMTAAHRPRYKRTANGMQTRAMTLRPSGPLGVVLVRLKAEEACRVLGCDLADMTDASVELADIFGDREASLLEEMLAEAENAEARVARMRQFLRDRAAANRFDPVVHRAIRALKQNPMVSMKDLASRLDVGERSLQRRFKTLTGVSPKQFARVARMEKVVIARLRGSDWADVAYATGYNDQAHLINDFRSLSGAPPEHFAVKSGRIKIVVEGREQIVEGGGSAVVPRGKPHLFANAGDGAAELEIEFRPAQQQLRFFANFATMAAHRPAWFSSKGDPNLLLIALVLHTYREHLYLAGPPIFLQKFIFALLAPVARLCGYRMAIEPLREERQLAPSPAE